MERKLVKQGKNAMTITIPSKWVKKNNLENGDVVEIEEKENCIIINNKLNKKNVLECNIDLTDKEKSASYHIIMGKYIEGYDKLNIKHNNPNLIQQIGKMLIGFIIEEHNENKTIMSDIIKVPEENFEIIFKRTLQLLIQQARGLVKVTEKKITYDQLKTQEYLLDDNILYSLRYLNKHENEKDSYRKFLLCSTIEQCGDQITELGKTIGEDKILAESILKTIEKYVTGIITKDFDMLYNYLKNEKNKIPKKTFEEGIYYMIIENLYNYIGFLLNSK